MLGFHRFVNRRLLGLLLSLPMTTAWACEPGQTTRDVNGVSRCVTTPAKPVPAKPVARIPLVHGLVETSAYRTNFGDEERIMTVTAATPTAVDFTVAQPKAAVLQQALSNGSCRATLNGVYFDFGQATLLPASKPALAAIAQLLRNKPTLTLRIEGHTDNIGSAAANLTLSQRRAAEVRGALTHQYKLPSARLQASGFGVTKPVASNSKLDGRAANRRVELSRTCPDLRAPP